MGKGRRGIPSGKSDLANIAVSGLITAKLPDERDDQWYRKFSRQEKGNRGGRRKRDR